VEQGLEGLSFLDVSDDGKFIVYGNNTNLALCPTGQLFEDKSFFRKEKKFF